MTAKQSLIRKLHPSRTADSWSPKLIGIVGGLLGEQWAHDYRGNYVSSISITSDGFAISQANAFLGSAADLVRNIDSLLASVHPSPVEYACWLEVWAQRVADYR